MLSFKEEVVRFDKNSLSLHPTKGGFQQLYKIRPARTYGAEVELMGAHERPESAILRLLRTAQMDSVTYISDDSGTLSGRVLVN